MAWPMMAQSICLLSSVTEQGISQQTLHEDDIVFKLPVKRAFSAISSYFFSNISFSNLSLDSFANPSSTSTLKAVPAIPLLVMIVKR
jgi:hypothetical protein